MHNGNSQPGRGLLFIYRYNDPTIYGGIERKILTIAKWLSANQMFTPHLLTNYGDSMFAGDFRSAGFPVHVVSMGGPFGIANIARTALALIEEHDIVLVQTHRFRESLAGAEIRRRNSRIRHITRVHTHIDGSAVQGWKLPAYHLLDRCAQPWVDSYVALSQTIRDELVARSHIAPSKVRIVPNGIPMLETEPQIEDGQNSLQRHVAVVGTVEERKRQEYLVRAIGHLRRERKLDVRLSLFGTFDPMYGEWMRNLVGQEGVGDLVNLAGYTDNVAAALAGIPVVAIASDFEGIPTSILEGMSAGRLVVATDVGGTADLVVDGVNGFLLPPGDWRPFAEVLERIWSAPAAHWVGMRRAAMATYQERFTVDAMMQGLLATYRDCGVL